MKKLYFRNKIHILQEKVPAVEKKPLQLVHLYLEIILLPLQQKCPYSGKYGPEKLRIRTLFMQCTNWE